jgi:anthranilate synthase/aminodeoxychorismate synthase-like glutamine amidotransferase
LHALTFVTKVFPQVTSKLTCSISFFCELIARKRNNRSRFQPNRHMILVIDNFDSFTYNLVQYLGICGAEVKVHRNNELSVDEIAAMDLSGILMSPGPCTPVQAGVCLPVTQFALEGKITVPLFGVCLGHQVLGHQSKSIVSRAEKVRHGKASPVRHDGKGIFTDVPSPFSAIRYHSLVIEPDSLHPDFEVSAWSNDDNEIMGIRHRELPIEGVQFHPESILTEHGLKLIQNFVDQTRKPH